MPEDILKKFYYLIIRTKEYPKKRRCQFPGCKTILSRYNGNKVCSIHKFDYIETGKSLSEDNYRMLARKRMTKKHCRNIANGINRFFHKLRRKHAKHKT